MISKQQQEVLATAIQDEAKAAADLSARKTELAMEAQELLNAEGLSGIKAIEMAFWFADEAEDSIVSWSKRKFNADTVSPQARKEMLDRLGSSLIHGFKDQFVVARKAAKVRQKEQRAGITRK